MKIGKINFSRRFCAVIYYLVGSGVVMTLFQNMTVPTAKAITCSIKGELSSQSGVPQFCDGSKYVSMKNTSAGSCSVAGQLSASSSDLNFCDGTTKWSLKGASIGSCSVTGTLSWNGTNPTICLSKILYSVSTPTFMIDEAFKAQLGRAATATEISSFLAGVDVSLISYNDILSVVKQGLSQNPSLASAKNSTWTIDGKTLTVAATSCSSTTHLQSGSCLETVAVCSAKTVRSCRFDGNYGMQACAADGSAWGSCEAPGALTSQGVVDNYVEVRSQPNQYYYNYAPDIIYDNGVYHMYWCAGVGDEGDYILHAQSSTAWGPFHASNNAAAFSYDVALKPTWNSATFDGYETCDPSVIKSGSTYILYYSGLATQSNDTSSTKIGMAVSTNGVTFTRDNGGNPIVVPVAWTANTGSYGVGQPSVFYIAPYYYLSFTDSTGSGGNGQYMMRSTDPHFQVGNQELIGVGNWVARGAESRSGQYKYLQAFSIDIAYDKLSGKIFVASDQSQGQHWVYIMDPNTLANYGYISMAGTWADGASVLKNADRTLLSRSSCPSLDLQLFKGDSPTAQYSDVRTWNISRSEAQFKLVSAICGQ